MEQGRGCLGGSADRPARWPPLPPQCDYLLPAGALGFEHLDVVPHKVCVWEGRRGPAWGLWQDAGPTRAACPAQLCCLPALANRAMPAPPAPPPQVTEGLPIEYLRFYRSGGYDFGTLVRPGRQPAAPWGCRPHSAPQRLACLPACCPSHSGLFTAPHHPALQAEEQGEAPVGGPGFGHPGSTRSPAH